MEKLSQDYFEAVTAKDNERCTLGPRWSQLFDFAEGGEEGEGGAADE